MFFDRRKAAREHYKLWTIPQLKFHFPYLSHRTEALQLLIDAKAFGVDATVDTVIAFSLEEYRSADPKKFKPPRPIWIAFTSDANTSPGLLNEKYLSEIGLYIDYYQWLNFTKADMLLLRRAYEAFQRGALTDIRQLNSALFDIVNKARDRTRTRVVDDYPKSGVKLRKKKAK